MTRNLSLSPPIPRALRIALLAIALCMAPSQLASQADDTAVMVRRLDSLLATFRTDSGPGCVIGVRRGRRTIIRANGFADLESSRPNDSGTVFEAGSVSKQVTAAAIVLLARRGTLSLEDDVRRWIPELSASLPRITIGQLLTHQSGLREWSDLVAVTGWPRGSRAYAMADMVSLVARQEATNFPPDGEYAYSNSNYLLAAEIVSRASRQSFAAFTQSQLFSPLGMTRTSWRTDYRARVAGRATAWSRDGDGPWMLDMPLESVVGPGGLLTTVPDLLRWNAALTGDELGQPLAHEMERAGVTNTGRSTGYALGLEVSSSGGERIVSHAGSTAGYRAYAGRVPARAASAAILCNSGDVNTERMGPIVLAIAAGIPSPPSEATPSLGAELPGGTDASRGGTYRNDRTRQPVTLREFAEGVTLNTWVGFRRHGNAFVTDDGARALRFDERDRGSARGFRVVASGDTVHYTRAEAWAPTSAELAALAGRYESSETGAAWQLEIAGDALSAMPRAGVRYTMVPVYRDAFRIREEGWLVTIRRDGAGRATGFDMASGRTRTLPFTRRATGD